MLDGVGHAAEGGDGVGAHDLRGDEEVDAVDEAGGEQSGVEARAGFGEQGENAFFAELVEDFGERDAARFGGQDFDADAALLELLDAGLVFGDGEDYTSFWRVATILQSRGMRRAESRTTRRSGRRRRRPLRSVSMGSSARTVSTPVRAASACQRRGWTAARAASQVIQKGSARCAGRRAGRCGRRGSWPLS
jgi:hypothetical protein